MSAAQDPHDRPNISVVAGTGEPPDLGGTRPPEPESQPPVVAPPPPPQDLTPDLGGQAASSPTPEQIVEATGGGLAAQMRARFEGMAATEEFSVPGWELPDGEPGLILVARALSDRKGWNNGMANELFIAKSTHKLLYVDDAGERHEIEGKWGPKLAEMVGVESKRAADLVAIVISKPDPDRPGQRISNVAGIGALANEIVAWARQSVQKDEDELGE